MRKRLTMICVCAAAISSASAEDRAAQKRAGEPAGASTQALSVSNRRGVELQQFEIFTSDANRRKVVGKLPKPLGAGESADVPLDKAKGCVFHARWSFADAQDSGEVDICGGRHIVLVD